MDTKIYISNCPYYNYQLIQTLVQNYDIQFTSGENNWDNPQVKRCYGRNGQLYISGEVGGHYLYHQGNLICCQGREFQNWSSVATMNFKYNLHVNKLDLSILNVETHSEMCLKCGWKGRTIMDTGPARNVITFERYTVTCSFHCKTVTQWRQYVNCIAHLSSMT